MSAPLTVACLQTRPMLTIAAAVDEALLWAQAAVEAGADILFLPEYCGGLCAQGAQLRPPAENEADHPFLSALCDFAARHQVFVQIGSIAITEPGNTDGKVSNRGFMIDDGGEIIGRYNKIHLFDVNLGGGQVYRESDTVMAGSCAVVHDTSKARIGHAICYDLRFPQLFRALAKEGAQILTCPAAFTKTTGEAHWHILNQARAIETTRFVVSPCAIGTVPGGGETFGHSLIIDPWGTILADGGTEPGVVMAKIDLAQIDLIEGRIPSLTNDQFSCSPPSKTDSGTLITTKARHVA